MLWNSSAIHPEMTALVAINHILYQLILYMLRLRKRNDEPWADFRRRGVRQARQLVILHLGTRWSTIWLSRWWGYQGHVMRCVHHNQEPGSRTIANFRSVEWWRRQQQLLTGMRHSGRYHPKLHPLDMQMNRAAQGEWREIALNRDLWKTRGEAWILQQDVPWCSGCQLAIED